MRIISRLEFPAMSEFPVHSSYTLVVVAHSANVNALTNFVSGDTHALWLNNSDRPQVLHGEVAKQAVSAVPIWRDSLSLIVVRYNELNSQAKLYINGEFADSLYVGANADSTLFIGAFMGAYGMQGEIDEVQLYDSELDDLATDSLSAMLIDRYHIKKADRRPSPDRTFTFRPVPMQLYPRGADDSASVVIAGELRAPGFDSMIVTVRKNGEVAGYVSAGLNYEGGSATFRLAPRIHAELAEYAVEVRCRGELVDSVLYRCDSIVCGDVFLVDGQSNAIFGYDDPTYSSEYARAFGMPYSQNTRDTIWTRAEALKWGDNNSVGGWPQRIQRDAIEREHVPTCCINGGASGTNIQSHERGAVPQDLRSIYGRMLYRVKRAGLAAAARFLVWDQGELNYDTGYYDYFKALRATWLEDYPNLSKIYVLQNRPNFCGWGNITLRNTQWHLQDSFPNIETIATAALPGHDGCHYFDAGMNSKGDRIWSSVARDFYGVSDTVGLRSPFLRDLRYSSSARNRILARFESATPLHITPDTTFAGVLRTLKDYLYLDDGTSVTDVSIAGNTLAFDLDRSASATTLTYLPDQFYNNTNSIYEGPWIVNEQGIGALLFAEYPINGPESIGGAIETMVSTWPDPASSVLHIVRTAPDPLQVEIRDVLGRDVLSDDWRSSGDNQKDMDIRALQAGTYFLRIVSAHETRTSTFVVARP
jgi:hypothetical protein